MPFEVGEAINAASDTLLRAPIVSTIANSPIYTAMMITFIIMLIIMFVFRDADTEETLFIMALRTGFWSFLTTLTIMFLHNKVLSREIQTYERDSDISNVFSSTIVPTGVGVDNIVPITRDTGYSVRDSYVNV
jgi:hypothetical protein